MYVCLIDISAYSATIVQPIKSPSSIWLSI